MVRDGDTGVLTGVNAAELADAVAMLWRDADAALAMARRANAAVARYTWPAVRQQWLDVYSARTDLDQMAIGAQSR
jgi:glycosyltransferase involved in cell wall biosynthesis